MHVLQPLGFSSSGFGCQVDLNVDPPDQPWPHERDESSAAVPVSPALTAGALPLWRGPAGAVHCSLSDWAKFAQLHLEGCRRRPTAILSAATFRQPHRPRAVSAAPAVRGVG